MNKQLHSSALLAAAAAAVLLAACSGGGGGGADATPSPAPAPATTATISGRAVDGALAGASACIDLNDDGACGSAEPRSAPTTADGRWQIELAAAEAGRHAVIVEVPADAVDADTGAAVGRAFVLRAPATGTPGSQSVFVSPLTTLVAAEMEESAVSRAVAEQRVAARAGLLLSPLEDFTSAATDAARHAARTARLALLTQFEQADALAGAVGLKDLAGITIAAADVERQVRATVLAALGAIGEAAADPALAAQAGSTLQASLRSAATTLAAQSGLTVEVMRAANTARKLAEPVLANPPDVSGSLTALSYTGPSNWMMRALLQSSDDQVADAGNNQRYYDLRQQAVPNGVDGLAVTYAWSTGNPRSRAGDLHWNGSAWVACTLNQRSVTRARDAQGRSDYDYCDGSEVGTTVRRFVDIAGRTIADVVATGIRPYPGSSAGVAFRNWGPSDLGIFGSATFPEGSFLIYHSQTSTATAYTYDVQASNAVQGYNAAVSAGGDARATPTLACNDGAQTAAAAQVPVTTLETLIARNAATPCIYNPGGTSPNVTGPTNQWWGNSTLSLGELAGINTLPPGTGNFYNTNAALRVGFAATGNGATFWRCYRRSSDNSPRNCSLMGLGTWKIQTLGDGRVLSFSLMPALAQRLGYTRVFVERGGQVYHGHKNPVGEVSVQPRLNLAAANEVAYALGLPRLRPITTPGTATGPRAAALATLKGAWSRMNSNGQDAAVLRMGTGGRFFLAEASPFQAGTLEQSGAELGWMDYDPVTRQPSAVIEVDSNLTSGLSHPGRNEPPVVVTDTAIDPQDGGNTLTRVQNAATGIVGLWALGSTTDLSVPHLAFFANGRFMLIDHQGAPGSGDCFNGTAGDGQCPPGVEFGSYTYDSVTGALRLFNLLYDTDGCSGAFSSCPAAVAQGAVNTEANFATTLNAAGDTFTTQRGADPTRTWFRIPNR